MLLHSFFFNLDQLGDFLHQNIPVGMHMDVLSMFFKTKLQIFLQKFQLPVNHIHFKMKNKKILLLSS